MIKTGLKLLKNGPFDLLVDSGRLGLRDKGVGPGGPADRWSFTLTNALAGNSEVQNCAALEFSLVGPTLLALEKTGCAISGTTQSSQIHKQDGSIHQLNPWSSFTLQQGDQLHLGPTSHGLRGYLAVQGGFTTPSIAGSRQSLAPLKTEAHLPCESSQLPARHMDLQWAAPQPKTNSLRLLPGPQWNILGWQGKTSPQATVALRSDRMGVRLQLNSPAPTPPTGLLSEPVCPGLIQAPSTNEWIILGVGCQTLGGYAKVGYVIDADLDRLGQLRPSDKVSLQCVEMAQALAANHARLGELACRCQAALAGLKAL